MAACRAARTDDNASAGAGHARRRPPSRACALGAHVLVDFGAEELAAGPKVDQIAPASLKVVAQDGTWHEYIAWPMRTCAAGACSAAASRLLDLPRGARAMVEAGARPCTRRASTSRASRAGCGSSRLGRARSARANARIGSCKDAEPRGLEDGRRVAQPRCRDRVRQFRAPHAWSSCRAPRPRRTMDPRHARVETDGLERERARAAPGAVSWARSRMARGVR